MWSWLGDLGTNILAEFIALTLLIALGWLVYFLTRRRRLLRFFGVQSSHRIAVYLSNLQVFVGGSVGTGNVPRSFQGSAVPHNEMAVALRFRDLFNFLVPSLADSPGFLSHLAASDVQVEISPSPTSGPIDSSNSLITLGSPGYNTTSAFADSIGSQAKIDLTAGTITVNQMPPIAQGDNGFVERIADTRNNRAVFYAAGLSELGTTGAAYYLATHWSDLEKKYGRERNFLVMLQFNHSDYRSASVVFER